MANCYFILMDSTRDRRDPEQMWFCSRRYLDDIGGLLDIMAFRHKVPHDAIRLYVCPDKKTWTKMSLDFQAQVDWSLVK